MATACQLPKDQFLCSICLDVFTEPVTLPCGHNFCWSCIDRRWCVNTKCMCPSCKKIFFYRPELKVNTFIAKMAAHFQQSEYNSIWRSGRLVKKQISMKEPAEPQASEKEAAEEQVLEEEIAKPGEVSCDMCPEPKRKAVKSCLMCLCSYCESHLEPHLKMGALRRHQLTEPQGNLEDRVCAIHNKPLELFCSSEHICVCVLCVYSEHKGHEVVPLNEAFEQQKILMQKAEDHIQEDIDRRMKKIAELRSSVGVSQAAADREISEGVKAFTALKETAERGQDLLISEISKKKTDTKDQAEGLIQELEQEICELKKRRAELQQQLSQSEDPFFLLQTSSVPSPLTPTRDWTSVTVCAPTYEGAVARALSQLEQDFNEKTRMLYKKDLNRVKTQKVDLTMDTESAPTRVQQTEDQRNIPESPKIVGLSESFYFEAEVKGKTEWTLGVAEESVNRKAPLTLNPQNGFWTITLKDGAYYVSDNPKISVFTKCRPEKVGVFVDSKEGVVSFYDVEAAALLYSFTGVTFKESLRPFYSPGHLWDSSSPVVYGTTDDSKGVLLDDLVEKLQQRFYTELDKKHINLDSQNHTLFEGILTEFRQMMMETDLRY
ncbi:E3 ubiquitin-protein ligase TRIM39-like [Boleophthalmus pectinirostris]|uniref:E3 ubiquitin-protein ligase TRIM39-like n=1 Tax=Boleophthalmus pectinirostris TaxID=150288 RepID=UPI002430DD66|nr:E3 ubiquitin-protein ligase TRIM39-like [Boleophthalmus pectinirostris]